MNAPPSREPKSVLRVPSAKGEHVDRQLLDALNAAASNVCEFGCVGGALARAYRQRNTRVHYTGVGSDAEALAKAGDALDASVACNLDLVPDWTGHIALDQAVPAGRVDLMVFGDVLERLHDPEAVLRSAVQRLRPGGEVVACIANVQSWHTFVQLIHGYWPRRESGLFHRARIRWFTVRNMREMFSSAGLEVVAIRPHALDELPGNQQRRERAMALLRPLVEAEGRNFDEFQMLSRPLQYIVIGRKRAICVPAVDTECS